MIFFLFVVYCIIGLIHLGVLDNNEKIETNNEYVAAFIFWPIYFVGYILKLVFYIGKLFFDTISNIVKYVFNV